MIIVVMGRHSFVLIDFVFGRLQMDQIGDEGATALAQQLCHLVNLEELQ